MLRTINGGRSGPGKMAGMITGREHPSVAADEQRRGVDERVSGRHEASLVRQPQHDIVGAGRMGDAGRLPSRAARSRGAQSVVVGSVPVDVWSGSPQRGERSERRA